MERKKKDIEKFKENVRQYDQGSQPGDALEGGTARPSVSPEEAEASIQPPSELRKTSHVRVA